MAEETEAQLQGVSLTPDMWTTINMDAHLEGNFHYVSDLAKLTPAILGALPFPQDHAAENITAAKRSLVVEWDRG